MDRIHHYNIVEGLDYHPQSFADRAKRAAVVLTAVGSDQKQPMSVTAYTGEPMIVKRVSDGPPCVDDCVSGNKDGVLRHAFAQQVLTSALGRRKVH